MAEERDSAKATAQAADCKVKVREPDAKAPRMVPIQTRAVVSRLILARAARELEPAARQRFLASRWTAARRPSTCRASVRLAAIHRLRDRDALRPTITKDRASLSKLRRVQAAYSIITAC